MRHWTDTPCTCGKSKIKGAHHDILCERMIARREQQDAMMAKTKQKREKRKTSK